MDQLCEFYDLLRRGTTVAEFLQRHAEIFCFIKSEGLTPDYRLARGRTKRLHDEVLPAAMFFKAEAAPEDEVQFPLDSGSDDCFWHQASGRRVTIQITIVQGTERFYLARELNDCGIGRGYLGLTDDKPTAAFDEAMAQPRSMFSTPEARKTIAEAVALSMKKKSQSCADLLLVMYPKSPFREERWREMQACISQSAEDVPYSKVFLVVEDYESSFVLRLKDAPFSEPTNWR